MFRIKTAAALAGVTIVCGTAAVYGYSSYAKWASSPVVFYVNPQNADVAASSAEAALQVGAGVWGTQSNAAFDFVYGGRVNDTSTGHDGRNVVIFRNATSGSALATTYSWWSGGKLLDSDIIFWDGGTTYFTGSSGCGGSGAAYLEDVAAHEFGHALGLNHTSAGDATMYPSYSHCSQSFRTLAADDIAGVEALYPPTTQPQNTAPVVSLSAPANNSSVTQGTSITFAGSASDAEDGTLTSSLRWTSSIDGYLATAGTFSRTLTVGTHLVTATATDSKGLTASKSVTVTVTATALPTGATAAATFVRTDVSTKGNWKGVYGREGYSLAGDGVSIPSYAQVQQAASVWSWAASTTDARGLQKVTGTDRVAATWYGSTIDLQLNLGDSLSHQVALYVLDWDGAGRSQTMKVIDAASGAVLDTRTATGFTQGQYLVWNLKGRVTIRLTGVSGPNTVYSALFFDAVSGGTTTTTTASGTAASATFVGTDTTTRGNWKGTYGAAGYTLANDGSNIPTFATVQHPAGSPWTWAASTSDSRGLQKAAAQDRIAAGWYGSVMDVSLNFTDGVAHRVALYVLDWDGAGRSQSVQVLDGASGAVLDTRTATGFGNGQYLIWSLKGRVTIRLKAMSGPNAVYSAVFFDAAAASTTTSASATFVGTDTTTRGDWKGMYGTAGYSLAGDAKTLPSYALVQQLGSAAWTWASSTSDGRALQKAGSIDRVAATWYGTTTDIDVSLVDGLTHQVSLYVLDWDAGGRSQRIQVIDPATGTILDTRTVTGFSGGQYFTWSVKGRVVMRLSTLSGPNSVYSAVFFDR